MREKSVDFAAAGRVSRRVELKAIRLLEISAKCNPKVVGPLEPAVEVDCLVIGRSGNQLEVGCNYQFTARTTQAEVADAQIKYLLVYEVHGTEPLLDGDLAEFSFANGTLHSWPFVREFVYGLTSRMGFPPYTLPVFHFNQQPQEKKKTVESEPVAPASPHSPQ